MTEVASVPGGRVAFAALVALLAASGLLFGPRRADAESGTASAAKSRSEAEAIAWRACGT